MALKWKRIISWRTYCRLFSSFHPIIHSTVSSSLNHVFIQFFGPGIKFSIHSRIFWKHPHLPKHEAGSCGPDRSWPFNNNDHQTAYRDPSVPAPSSESHIDLKEFFIVEGKLPVSPELPGRILPFWVNFGLSSAWTQGKCAREMAREAISFYESLSWVSAKLNLAYLDVWIWKRAKSGWARKRCWCNERLPRLLSHDPPDTQIPPFPPFPPTAKKTYKKKKSHFLGD